MPYTKRRKKGVSTMSSIIIAIDPGREKCGVAVVDQQQGVLMKQVIATSELANRVKSWAEQYRVQQVVMGDGTSSQGAMKSLKDVTIAGQALVIEFIDEHHSTDEARSRYWKGHPPRGLMRLVPVTMRVPPEPVDDYVAVILAERYFAQMQSRTRK